MPPAPEAEINASMNLFCLKCGENASGKKNAATINPHKTGLKEECRKGMKFHEFVAYRDFDLHPSHAPPASALTVEGTKLNFIRHAP